MILNINPGDAVPVYEQIRVQVTTMVATGVLAEGTRLPTIRQLANDLGLAKGTVAKAYSLLEDHGVVRSRGTRGTFVRAIAEAAPPDSSADPGKQLTEAAQRYAVTAVQLGLSLDEAHRRLNEQWGNLS